nr:probable 3-deoxy-D-manno-octulosonic acid transferase, mitochondrial isoform X1 [Tanacetum cinerariifolium]
MLESKCPSFRVVASIAIDIMAIQISIFASESPFSTGGRVLDPYRNYLSSKIVEVGGGLELEAFIDNLLSNPEILEERKTAAKQAFHYLSSGVIENVWTLLEHHILKKAQVKDAELKLL